MKKEDLHWYLRTLEEVLIETLGAFGLKGERIPGLTGVWVDGAKVAAIGVRATRWVTYHGLALNVTTDLSPFQDIVPCGIEDRPVTSMHDLLKNNNSKNKDVDQEVLVKQVAQKLLEHFALLFDVDYVVI
jgi:lipoyl(octanoyl) transferase